MAADPIIETVAQFIIKTFLPGAPRSELNDYTQLITGGILDSLSMLRFVAFLEEEYGIEVHPRELTPQNFDNLARIAAFVRSKKT